MSSIYFFATRDDLIEVMNDIAKTNSYEIIYLDRKKGNVQRYQNIKDIKNLAEIDRVSRRGFKYFVYQIVEKDTQLEVVEYTISDNSKRYEFKNLHAFNFYPNGLVNNLGFHDDNFQYILRGVLQGYDDMKNAPEWMKSFYKASLKSFKKLFKRVKNSPEYVGKKAEEMLKNGTILSISAIKPLPNDVKLEWLK